MYYLFSSNNNNFHIIMDFILSIKISNENNSNFDFKSLTENIHKCQV